MPVDPRRVKELFNAALDLLEPLDRLALVDRECVDDPELRARLMVLLAANDQPAEALAQPLVEAIPGETQADTAVEANPEKPAVTVAGPTEVFRADEAGSPIGTIIAGRYKVRQVIGEGGMGSVYLVEQSQPIRRQVALKLIKAGMDSRTVLARFESERQALALMDHPHIAKVLDAGSTEAGRPFFVMELVKGIPLTEYCDHHQLGLPERLTLFRQICSAVQHAHQKGIIHRDLKPTNILVESHDGKPVPKVIDFGLAKATSGIPLTDQSLFTAFGSVTGTPLYMAPEQATFNALDVDTRADIYALGVILYELLTGSTPIRRDTIRRAALDEMLRLIREEEPPTPSSRISTSEALPSLAAARHVDPARLSRLVRGDLDWIVMKALAKERNRRYDSAIGMAQDVERYLNHEPVSAGPPGAAYRLRKFARRNRGRVAAATLVLLSLIVGVLGTARGLVEARRQELMARQQEAIAVDAARQREAARRSEAAQRQKAEKRLVQIGKINEILGSVFRDLDPRTRETLDKPLSVLLGERLDQATAQIEGEAIGDPLVVGRMQVTLGRSLLNLGEAEKASLLLAKARATLAAELGAEDPETLACMASLADAYRGAGHADRAIPIQEEVLALRKARLGPDHPETLRSLADLADACQGANQLARAITTYEEVLALTKAKMGPGHVDTLRALNRLVAAYQAAKRYKQARYPRDVIPLYEKAVEASKARLGTDHPDTIDCMVMLSEAYALGGSAEKSCVVDEEVLKLRKARLGPDHPDTLSTMLRIAGFSRLFGQYDRAIPLYDEVLTRRQARLGPDHPETVQVRSILDELTRFLGATDRAMPLNYRVIPLFEQAVALRKAELGPDHHDTLVSMVPLAEAYRVTRQPGRVVLFYEQVVPLLKARLGLDHPDTLGSMAALAELQRGSRAEGAIANTAELVALWKRKAGADSLPAAWALNLSGVNLRAAGRLEESEAALLEALAIREAKEPDAWTTFETRSSLGSTWLARQKVAEAEPLLRAGYEGMKQRLATIPRLDRDRFSEAIDRLIKLAEKTGKPDEARSLKEERARMAAPTSGGKAP